MLKLPYLSTNLKCDPTKNGAKDPLLDCQDITGYFKLKEMGKIFTRYQIDQQQGQTEFSQPYKAHFMQQDANMIRASYKKESSEEIMEKAKNINNRHYLKNINVNKTSAKGSASLQKKNFSLQEQQSFKQTYKENCKQNYPKITEMENKLKKNKNSKHFRSQLLLNLKQA